MKAELNYLGIVVDDMPRSLRFYRLLGMDIPEGAEREDHVDVTLPSGLRVGFDTTTLIRSFDPGFAPSNGSPRTSLAFGCASPADVDALYAAAEQAGFQGHKEPWDAFWGQRYAQLRDPDGNGVDLYAPLG
jgi:uncharacterized glyoxalase superfamily protein PhnB